MSGTHSSLKVKKVEDKKRSNNNQDSTTSNTSTINITNNKNEPRKLPFHLEEMRRKVFVENEAVSNVASILAPDAYSAYGVKKALTLTDFKKDFAIDIIEQSKDKIVFDMIGIEAPLANALRRILLSEVPTLAIEKVIIFQNTSIIQDEVLAHRLGLVPIAIDPRLFKYLHECNGIQNEINTLVFTLDVACQRNPSVPDNATNEEKYTNSLVTTAQLIWQPQGRQLTSLPTPPRPYYNDIVIAKLRPGQSIEAELHCEKGVGQQHAKWSPVATASYRLLPEIRIVKKVRGKEAKYLKSICPMNVFDIEDMKIRKDGKREQKNSIGSSRNEEKEFDDDDVNESELDSNLRAVVARPRNCSMCRECIRGAGWAEKIQLRRVRDHFIFSVETTGAYVPAGVVKEAIGVLRSKAERMKQQVKIQMEEEGGEEGEEGSGDDDQEEG